ncbi:MAG TPA: CocE/NonD family hydrolase [Nevskia sp.]|nr:CocE/NonD family hydrolase [Nevskia sp.]
MSLTARGVAASVLSALLLAGCGSGSSAPPGGGASSGGSGGGSSSGGSSSSGGGSGSSSSGGSASCPAPLPPVAIASGLSVTDAVPSDYDSSASPTPTPTTTINFTLMLPQRCPGDRFPLILQSHGYGGTRLMALAANGTVDPTAAHFTSIDNLVMALPYHGYVVISYDERGHGTAAPGQAANNARIIDPAAETQDAEALLDWAYYHRDAAPDPNDPAHPAAAGYVQSFVQAQAGAIPRDIVAGTIGYSYGGGFEFPLEQLDPRIDTMVPNGTWNDLLYSLLPGDAVKLGFDSLLCVLASPTPGVGGNVNNTPLVANTCNQVGPQGPQAVSLRTRADLAQAATLPTAQPRPARDEAELLDFFYSHSNQYFQTQTRDGAALDPRDVPGTLSPALLALPGFAGASFRPAPLIPAPARATPASALLLQGNRDTLFNLTDAWLNYQHLRGSASNVRLLTTEGGHMNPLALQTEGTANCGGVVGVDSILAWFDHELKGVSSAAYSAIPPLCLSVTPTPAANSAPANSQLSGLLLADGNVPVGDQGGKAGGISVKAAMLSASVNFTGSASSSTPTSSAVFVPVGAPLSGLSAIPGSGGSTVAVLAGLPSIRLVSVSGPLGAALTPVAYVGVGIKRGSTTILVDDQVTPFAALAPAAGSHDCPASLSVPTAGYAGTTTIAPLATDHCHNRGTNDYAAGVLLPGVGEPLQNGDQLGLLLYENQVQYLPVNSGAVVTGLPNPYSVTLYDVQLPVLVPGAYAGSSLSGATALP